MKRNVNVIEGEKLNMKMSKYTEYENGLITTINCANSILYENGQITLDSASRAAKFYLSHTMELDAMFNKTYSEERINFVRNSVLERYFNGTTLDTIVELHYQNFILAEANKKITSELGRNR